MTEPSREVLRPCRAGGGAAGFGGTCAPPPSTEPSRSAPTELRKGARATFPEGKMGDLT